MKMLSALLLAATLPALAHHSISAEFDLTKPVEVQGAVTKIEWMNPHAWLYVDVTGAEGGVEHWQFEFGAPAELLRRGWHRHDLEPGDRVTVQGLMAKYKEFTARAQSILLPDGKRVFTGNPGPASGGVE